jgi:hypothetical protein
MKTKAATQRDPSPPPPPSESPPVSEEGEEQQQEQGANNTNDNGAPPPKSKFRGLAWDKQEKQWRVRISFEGKQRNLGRCACALN